MIYGDLFHESRKLVKTICFDFVEKGRVTCCRLVASWDYIGIFVIEFTSIFEFLEVC